MPPPSSSPPTPNTTIRSHPLHRLTLCQPSTTSQVGPIVVISVSQAYEVDCELEVDCVVKSKTSAALSTPPIPSSFQHWIIRTMSTSYPNFSCRGSNTSTTIVSLGGIQPPPPHHCPLRAGRGTEMKATGGGGDRDGSRDSLKGVWTANGYGEALQLTREDPHDDGLWLEGSYWQPPEVTAELILYVKDTGVWRRGWLDIETVLSVRIAGHLTIWRRYLGGDPLNWMVSGELLLQVGM